MSSAFNSLSIWRIKKKRLEKKEIKIVLSDEQMLYIKFSEEPRTA